MDVIAVIYLSFAIVMGCGLAYQLFDEHRSEIVRGALCWLFITFLAFAVSIPSVFFGLAILSLAILSPADKDERLVFFFVMLPVLPGFVRWLIPFPGLDFLFEINNVSIVTIGVLLPLLFASNRYGGKPPVDHAPSDRGFLFMFLLFLLVKLLLDFRGTTVTDNLRSGVETVLELIVPVYAVYRFTGSVDSVRRVLAGIAIAACIVGSICMIQIVKVWPIYSEIPYSITIDSGMSRTFEIRGGLIRVPAMMGVIPVGFFMAAGFFIVLTLRKLEQRRLYAIVFLAISLLSVYASGSRGAWISFVAMAAAFAVSSGRLIRYRKWFVVIGIVFIAPITSFVVSRLVAADPFGTIQYRLDLLTNALRAIADNPVWGDPYFLTNPNLQSSLQGQGIIDVVNAYLGICLRYGVVGLILFSLPVMSCFRKVMKRHAYDLKQGNQDSELIHRFLTSYLFAALIFIFTTSFVDRIELYLWIFLMLGNRLSAVQATRSAAITTRLTIPR